MCYFFPLKNRQLNHGGRGRHYFLLFIFIIFYGRININYMGKTSKKIKKILAQKRLKEKEKIMEMIYDTDRDGLSDYQEKLYGTNPTEADTDHDGLSDYEEIKIYQTDPLNSDTNNNGLSDGEEVKAGKNPRGTGQLKDLFIAYSGNGYQPGFLQPKRLVWYGAVALLIKAVAIISIAVLPISAWVTPDVATKQARNIINLTNQIRNNLDLPPLTENKLLSEAAMAKAQDMLSQQYFSHLGPDKNGLKDWLKKSGYQYLTAGENLAMGFADAAEVVNAWTQSKTHYANMIDPNFKEIGVGIVSGAYRGYDTTLVAQFFGLSSLEAITEKELINTKTTEPSINASTSELVAIDKPAAQVFGEKITRVTALDKPRLIYPADDLITKENKIKFKIFAPGAETLKITVGQWQSAPLTVVDDYCEEEIALVEGVSSIMIEASAGSQRASSTTYTVTVDQTAPTLDYQQSQLLVNKPIGQEQQIVQAKVFLSADTAAAAVAFGNYTIKLNPAEQIEGLWTGSMIIFQEQQEELFNPVVLATVTAEDLAGNFLVADLPWDNIVPVKSSLLDQYFFAKHNSSSYVRWILTFSRTYYHLILGLLVTTLTVNIVIQIKKQNLKLIFSSLALISLLVLLLLI